MCLSHETRQGLVSKLSVNCFYTYILYLIVVTSFTELGPKLLKVPGVNYLLSEVFSQVPLERYFSRQRHRGGSNDNPTAFQVPFNASSLIQQQHIYRDLKTMNVRKSRDEHDETNLEKVSQPLGTCKL